VVDTFTNTVDWKLQSGGGTAYVLDATYTRDTGSIRLSGTGIAFMRNTATVYDLTGITGMRVSAFIPDATAVGKVIVYLANDVGFTKYATFTFNTVNLMSGWNELAFGLDQLSLFGGFDSSLPVNALQVRIEPANGKEAVVYFDKLYTLTSNIANIVFTMDDAWITQYSEAYRLLENRDMKGNIAVIPTKVGEVNYMNLDQLQEVYAEGWDLLNHTNTHIRLGDSAKEVQREELLTTAEWLIAQGFTRTPKAVVYPYGSYNTETLQVLEEEGFTFGRSLIDGLETNPINSKFEAKAINLTQDVTVEAIKKRIDGAIATGSTIFFLNHRFGPDIDSMFYDVGKYQEIISYVADKRDAKQVNILTISQLLTHFG
jgi:peptidoglycan/xylan/chitin deacetylase (PgdA/CDA1 family)